ncbi:MAG: cobaltochelatase subunit CobN [Chitinivibrionales bacterium]
MKKKLITGGVLVFVIALFLIWKAVAPTRILFINYRDWQVAEYLEVNRNHFISVDRSTVDKVSARTLKRYDLVIVFAMGLRLSQEQQSMFTKAAKSGTKILMSSSTTPESDVTNIPLDQVAKLREYLSYGGNENIQAFFAYARRDIDRKLLFAPAAPEPKKSPSNQFQHPDAKSWFATYDEYQKWYSSRKGYNSSNKRVLILASNTSMSSKSSARPYSALIAALEKRGLNVYSTSGFTKRLEYIEQVDPAIVLLFAHGRLAMGMPDSAIALLERKNIPLLSPLVVHQLITDWNSEQIGMTGGMLGQSIVAPEMDGATTPFVIGGLAENDKGYQVFVDIPERIERFSSMVSRYIALKEKENKDKRIAIVYFKGPGKNALLAAGLEVAPSLLNTLRHLRQQGYSTGPLPSSEKEFDSLLQQYGSVLGTYAQGSIDRFLKGKETVRIHGDTLLNWMKQSLDPVLVDSVQNRYGTSPGQYLVNTDSSGTAYLGLPAIRFGNVVILPQLMPALGDDEFSLVHGAKQPPPYPYIATYLWARNGFGADALVHFGTHGSLEFTPWKQSALSSQDWPDALVGDMPHFYLYTINNIGEAMIAKRRSYADLVSHITPPFKRGDLYSGLLELHRYIDQYETSKEPALRTQLWQLIRKKALEEKLDVDLNLPALRESELDSASYSKIHRYLHIVESEKITDGLYTLGVPYTNEQVSSTIVEMFGDRLAHSRARLDMVNQLISQDDIDDAHLFEHRYLSSSRAIVKSMVAGEEAIQLIGDSLMEQYRKVEATYDSQGPVDVMGAMVAMMGDDSTNIAGKSMPEEDLHECLSTLLADEDLRKQLLRLEDKQAFKRMSALLDESSLRQAKRMAKVVPAMGEALAFFDVPCARQLLMHLQGAESRKAVFALVKGDSLKQIAQEKKQRAIDSTIAYFDTDSIVSMIRIANEPKLFGTYVSKASPRRLKWATSTLKQYIELPEPLVKNSSFNNYLASIRSGTAGRVNIQSAIEEAEHKLLTIKEQDQTFAAAVREILEIQSSTQKIATALETSGSIELGSLTNALNGGYIAPSTGGDAVHNPDALPTGRNLYGINPENTPGEAAWKAGVNLAKEMIAFEMGKNGKLPRKVAFTLWGGEFIRDQGTTIAQILHLLGVEPIRTSTGRVQDVRLIPANKLGRPRIDVVVQTSGQFRDIASSRLFLIDRAVSLAALADDKGIENYVREGTVAAEKHLKEKGLSPLEARSLSTARVFGGVNGNYGTGIMGLVESGDKYDSDTVIANQYLKNMGAVYTQDRWGNVTEGLFEAALINTDVIMHSRSSNTSGPLSLDHVYEFMGGLNTAVKKVTGKDPQGLFIDMRNPNNGRIVDAKEAVWTEARSTVLNPNYISPLLKGGKSSAEVFAETVRNTFGWNATKEPIIDEELWDKYYETLVKDTFDLGTQAFFDTVNPYALQEITAVMLETVRKGMWTPDSTVIRDLADTHVKIVEKHEAGCSGFVCDNAKLAAMIGSLVNTQAKETYKRELSQVRDGVSQSHDNAITLKKESFMETLRRVAVNNGILLGVMGLIVVVLAVPFFRKRKES